MSEVSKLIRAALLVTVVLCASSWSLASQAPVEKETLVFGQKIHYV